MENETPIHGWKAGRFLNWQRNGKTIKYDLADQSFKRQLKNGQFRDLSDASVSNFFRGLDLSEVITNFTDVVYRPLMQFAYICRKRKTNMGSILQQLPRFQHYESYLLLGIDIQYRLHRNTFKRPISQFSKPIIQFMVESQIRFNDGDWEENTLSNFELVQNLCSHVLNNYKNELQVYRMLYDIVITSYSPLRYFKDLLVNYNCEYKSLFNYCVKMYQTEAISVRDSLELYRDYLSMMQQMNNPRIQKYTSNLKLRHDLTDRNFKAWEKVYDEEKFAATINTNYEWRHKKYCIVVPKLTLDIKREGTDQHHCVGSYVDSVLDGTTQIVFMRDKGLPDVSLITVEIRNHKICQARGNSNRALCGSEIEWLKSYAKAKNLDFLEIRRDKNLITPTPNKEKEKCEESATVISTASNMELAIV